MITVQSVGKAFSMPRGSGFRLSDINLSLLPGQTTGIIGTNGSGKSTLLKIIAGMLKPDSGKISIPSEWHRSISGGLQSGRGCLYLDQDAGRDLVPSMTVLENIALAQIPGRIGSLRWACRKSMTKASIEALRTIPLGLDSRLTEQVRFLSGGERQGLVLARALVVRPLVFLLDEFVSALAHPVALRIMDTITNLVADERRYCAFVTHDVDVAVKFAQQIVFLHQGQQLECFPVEDSRSQSKVIELFTRCLGGSLPNETSIRSS